MQRKTQKWTVIIIIAVICITLVGSTFVAFQLDPQQTAEMQNQEILKNEYNVRQQTVEALTAKLQGDPDNTDNQRALGDAYYQKAQITAQLNINEHQEDLQKAIEMYQMILAKQEDNDASLKLANTAFLAGDSKLAGETYSTLLAKEPENVEALYGYGMYLFYDKGDSLQAGENWQKALNLTDDEQLKPLLQSMIDQAREIAEIDAGLQKENK